MPRAPNHHPPRPGFAARRVQELVPPPRGRDWDVRFVSATLLFYGLVGAAFFLVDWLNTAAPEDALPPAELAIPSDGGPDRARTPYLIRLPKLLKDREAADDMPPESR